MHVITRRRLLEFAREHPDVEPVLEAWYRMMRAREYVNPHEVQEDFRTASFLGEELTVFNIGGNKYRLVVFMVYSMKRVFIHRVLTHAEYDRRLKAKTLV